MTMPIHAPARRIADESLVLRTQGVGQPTAPGAGTTGSQAVPPGTEHTQGAFGIFGMMISGLIIVFAIVLLFLRSRRRG
jgi:hypothetical protein